VDEAADLAIDELAGRTDALVRAFLAALGELTEHERLTGLFFTVDGRSPDRHRSVTTQSLQSALAGPRSTEA